MNATVILAGLQLSAENIRHYVRITHSCDPLEFYSQLYIKMQFMHLTKVMLL